jgi:N-acyl-D-amino-acid deacylase
LGRTLADIGEELGTDPVETLIDIVASDFTGGGAAYFIISDENIRRQVQLPWVSFGSDADAIASEDPFTRHPAHPRAYGNFARLLGHYVRTESLLPLAQAVHRLSATACEHFGLRRRGRIEAGYFADLVVFDPGQVAAEATYAEPHRYARGVRDVIVNGVPALRNGTPTERLPGRILRRGE